MKKLWEKLPKEVRVGVYVVGSAALAELIMYLELVKIDNLVLAGCINIVVVLLKNRIPQLKAKLNKK